jgi:hypothetical protein
MAHTVIKISGLTPLLVACTLPWQHERDYTCADGYEFSVRYSGVEDPGDVAFLSDETGEVRLPRAPAEGAKASYSNGATTFVAGDDSAAILRNGEPLHEDCAR